jgi:hypothetical protein
MCKEQEYDDGFRILEITPAEVQQTLGKLVELFFALPFPEVVRAEAKQLANQLAQFEGRCGLLSGGARLSTRLSPLQSFQVPFLKLVDRVAKRQHGVQAASASSPNLCCSCRKSTSKHGEIKKGKQ